MRYILTILLLVCSQWLFAQQVPIDLSMNDIVKEVQQIKNEGKNTKIVFWYPQEYWDVCANNDPSFQKSLVALVQQTFRDYTMILATDMYNPGDGIYTYTSDSEMRANIKLVDGQYNEYRPLADKDLSDTVRLFRDHLSPAMSKNIGELGKHARLYLFKTGENSNTNSALKSGSFKVVFDNTTFRWALPLACMLPPKYCPIDELKMNGDWLYCPYHGVKLGK